MSRLRHGGQPDRRKNRRPNRQTPTHPCKGFTKSHLPTPTVYRGLASLRPDIRCSIDNNGHRRGEFQSRLPRDTLGAKHAGVRIGWKPADFSNPAIDSLFDFRVRPEMNSEKSKLLAVIPAKAGTQSPLWLEQGASDLRSPWTPLSRRDGKVLEWLAS
jgi:hypothetical protein